MNPYDFVRIDWSRPPERHQPIWHHQLVKQGTKLYSGSLQVEIYVETPLFVSDPRSAEPDSREAALSIQNAAGEYIIPGSSLKGMLRSVVETLGNSCLTLFDGEYRGESERLSYTRHVPDSFQHCTDNASLCLACRTFGMLKGGRVFLGKINIGDAHTHPDNAYLYDPLYTAVLVEPKPRHEAFYLDQERTYIAGRKFYFHHSPDGGPLTASGLRRMGGRPANRYIQPLDRDTTLTFRLDFTSLEADELGALLQAIILDEDTRHKIGYGKPLGLGSIELRPTSLTLIDYASRYTRRGARQEQRPLTGEAMWDKIYTHADSFTQGPMSAMAMEDLRRIWRWPPESGVTYYYPSKQYWFDTPASKGKRIRDTTNVPGA
ncbi:MAG TPA: RAMP superfamily CRISPR-associated protein [Ktedonobacteraceae bacterium]|jgi:hypothetical protein